MPIGSIRALNGERMTNYDRLEQLSRLRASGALSDTEFEAEKAKLIGDAPQKRFNLKVVGIAAALFAIVLAVLSTSTGIFASSPHDTPTDEVVPARLIENATADPIPTEGEASEAPGPARSLAWAFSPAIIGLNPDYVETVLGPPFEKSTTSWSFDVEGCPVWYSVRGAAIENATTSVYESCQPTVDGFTITPNTTFGQVGINDATIRATCIYNCGNAFDPTIDLFRAGFRANNNIEVLFRSNYGDAQSSARDAWRKSIRSGRGLDPEGYEGDNYEWYQCVSSPPAAVASLLKSETISAVVLGRSLDADCPY